MKIAINIQPLLHSSKSGIGFYQHEMMKAVLAYDKTDIFYFNYFDLTENKKKITKGYLQENTVDECCGWFNASLYQLIWSIIPVPYSLFFKSKPDVSMFFNYYLPPFVRGKKVLVVYDTVIKDFPETVRFKTKVMLRLTLKRSIRRADKIVTISRFSKDQIIKHFGVDPDDIVIIPCAADTQKYFPIENISDAKKTISDKYGIDGDYYLYLGNLEPRKNIPRLIEAYAEAGKRQEIPRLVIAGVKGWLYDDIFNHTKELGLSDKVIFTGYVDDDDVPLLMNCALAFCFPSIYEGFGMPPLEAMSCGVPVIVSKTSSLPEVVGDSGIYVDPYDVSSIADALIKVLDIQTASQLREKGISQAATFSWKKSAEKLKQLFEELYNEQDQNSSNK